MIKNILLSILLITNFSFNQASALEGSDLKEYIYNGQISCDEAMKFVFIINQLNEEQYCGQYQTCMEKEELYSYLDDNKSIPALVGLIVGYILNNEFDRLVDYEKVRSKVITTLDDYGEQQSTKARKRMARSMGCE